MFLCDLTLAERAELEAAVLQVMVLWDDSVMEIDLGPVWSQQSYGTSAFVGGHITLAAEDPNGSPPGCAVLHEN